MLQRKCGPVGPNQNIDRRVETPRREAGLVRSRRGGRGEGRAACLAVYSSRPSRAQRGATHLTEWARPKPVIRTWRTTLQGEDVTRTRAAGQAVGLLGSGELLGPRAGRCREGAKGARCPSATRPSGPVADSGRAQVTVRGSRASSPACFRCSCSRPDRTGLRGPDPEDERAYCPVVDSISPVPTRHGCAESTGGALGASIAAISCDGAFGFPGPRRGRSGRGISLDRKHGISRPGRSARSVRSLPLRAPTR